MTLPAGSRLWLWNTNLDAKRQVIGCRAPTSSQTLAVATTLTNSWTCGASIPHFPATFWHRTVCPAGDTRCRPAPDCVAENPATNPNASCVASPDGLGRLRRYEIRSGNAFPSGRTYADEMQNFANWFTYYRKRKLLLAATMGRVLNPATGLRLGVVPFNNPATVTMWDADGPGADSNRFRAAGAFYLNGMTALGTPTHAAMMHAGGQFNVNTDVVQYACQRNNLFVVTDGFSQTSSTTPPPWDPGRSAATWGAGPPWQITVEGSLADLGLRFYTNRLRAAGPSPLPAGRVPPGDPARSNPILNTDLHIVTYGITIGARGRLYPTAADPFAVDVFAQPPKWPQPVARDASMIDDLWHATVNGRGRMFLATDVDGMLRSMESALEDITSQKGAQGGVAVSSVNLERADSQAYLASYDTLGWGGNLSAYPLDASGNVDSTRTLWSAAALLAARDWKTRTIFTAPGGAGVDFTAATTGLAAGVVEYLRGNRSGEGTQWRARRSLLGAVIGAEPVIAREDRMVYLASGEGMLHAFDTTTGREEWAYVPADVVASMGASAQPGWTFRTLFDATPTHVRLADGSRLLVTGLGPAGRSYHALNVSQPRGLGVAQAAAQFRWRFTHPLMGHTVGKPVVVRTAAGERILVTSGYDKGLPLGDGLGRLWVLRPDGTVEKSFRTVTARGLGGGAPHPRQENGLAHVSGFQESDGTVRWVYGGDLLGNLWRFDLTRSGADIAAERVAVLTDAAGRPQPVTAPPELATVAGRRVILVGTGRLLDFGDLGQAAPTHAFYAIADDDRELDLPSARASLVRQVFERGGRPELLAQPVDFATQRGWYFDLPAGEHANTEPSVAYGAVAFVTNRAGSTDCAQESYLFVVDVARGARLGDTVPSASVVSPPLAFFSPAATRNDTLVSTTISTTANASRVTVLRTRDGRIVGTAQRSDGTPFRQQLLSGVAMAPSKNAWREIRR